MAATRVSLGDVLETMTKSTLVRVLEELAAKDPQFEGALRRRVAPVDSVERDGPQDFEGHVRRLVHSLDGLRQSEAYWQVGEVVDRVLALVKEVEEIEGRGALVGAAKVLEGLTRAYVQEWRVLDDSDGRCTEPLVEMGALWTRLMLRMHRKKVPIDARWTEALARWHAEALQYEITDFGAALEAAERGWKSPMLGKDWRPKGRPAAVQDYADYLQESVRERFVMVASELEDEEAA